MRTRHVVLSLLIALACTAPLGAQSFLGSIRGTVVDPQGGAVKGAAVLITDEATNTPRAVDTDAEGRYEAANLKPGMYRVEVVTPNFKKFEQTGISIRVVAASASREHDVGL
jgi:protocatechuate 3,4-dioxygenase beta subunit